MNRMTQIIITIILLFLIIALLPMWPYATHWGVGAYPSSFLGLILMIFIIAILARRL